MIVTALSQQRKRKMYMKPIIVPPVSEKREIMHQDIQPLWETAASVLRSAERIVIAGYSRPPMDLEARFLLAENIRANDGKKVYVIDPNAGTAAKFEDISGVDHVTIYSSLPDWIRDKLT